MKLIYAEQVEIYLNELVDILYAQEYFGHKSTAYDYVGWIIDTIEKDILTTPFQIAPPYFSKYGKDLYCSIFKRNLNTQWYVFFNRDLENDTLLIQYIGNNHTCAQYFE